MKKKTILIILVSILLLLISLYFLNYFLLIEDEQSKFEISNPDILLDNNSVVLSVSNFDTSTCTITSCELNNCEKSFQLPCEIMSINEFQGLATYKVQLNFEKYLLYPWSNKRKFKSWSIEASQSSIQEISYANYLQGLKSILKDSYVWEVLSIPLSKNTQNLDNILKQESVKLDWEYAKDLDLLYELSQQLGDSELRKVFDREIDYLNDNSQTVIEITNLEIPNPYIPKLVEKGLDSKYLSLNSNYEIPQYFKETLNINATYKSIHMANDGDLYSSEYIDLINWSDLYKKFRESGNTKLANYSESQMFNIYTNTEYVLYGLCSVVNASPESVSLDELKTMLEQVFSNDQSELIEINIYELMMCKEIFNNSDQKIVEVDDVVSRLLSNISLSINDNLFIVRGLPITSDQEEGPNLIVNYNMLDNLVFLVNYYEK